MRAHETYSLISKTQASGYACVVYDKGHGNCHGSAHTVDPRVYDRQYSSSEEHETYRIVGGDNGDLRGVRAARKRYR